MAPYCLFRPRAVSDNQPWTPEVREWFPIGAYLSVLFSFFLRWTGRRMHFCILVLLRTLEID